MNSLLKSEDAVIYATALDTLNKLLQAHSEEFPFRQVLKAASKLFSQRNLEIAIKAKDSQTVAHSFTLQFVEGQFAIVAVACQQTEADITFSHKYLQEIASDPEKFIDNPGKLQLDWLKDLGSDPFH